MKKFYLKTFLLFLVSSLVFYEPGNAQCGACAITGDSQINTGESKSYSATALSGATFFWSVTGGASISGANNGQSVTILGTNSGTGKVCVTRFKAGSEPCCECKDLTINGAGGGCVPYSSSIYAINLITGSPATVCPNEGFAVGITQNVPPGYYVQWSISPNMTPSSGSLSNNQASYLEFTDIPLYTQYTVAVSFYCNSGAIAGNKNITVRQNTLNCDYIPAIAPTETASIYPNPSSNEVTLELPESALSYQYLMLNSIGEVKYQANLSKGSHKIDISKLDKGLYYIKLFRSDNWVNQIQFVKE